MGNGYLPLETFEASLRDKSDEQRYTLWDTLAEFGSDEMDGTALQFCMRHIASTISAQQAFWGGTVRVGHDEVANEDSSFGWRLGAWSAMGLTNENSPEWMKKAARVFNTTGARDLKASRRVLEQTGNFRVFTLSRDIADFDAYRKSEAYDYYFRQQGIVDRIWIVFPVNNDSESCFCFDRMGDHPYFDDQEIKMAADMLRGIKWFHRQLLLARGLGVAEESLTPAECRVVRQLLTGASERVIADRLNLTPASAHQYVVSIFRKFGVHGRPEFMALWLNTLP